MSLLTIKNKIGTPSDWKMVPIGKVLVSSQYGTSNGNSATGVPVIGMKNLQDGKVDFNDLPLVSVDEAEKESLLLHDGDILLNRTNSYDLVGKVGFVEKAIEAVFASYLVRLKVNMTKSDPKFVAMWLTSFWADQMIKKIATRAVSQANVNPTEFKKFCLVPVPPLPEQKAIADLLSTWDEAIEKTERLIQAKELRFRWLLRELISDQYVEQNQGSEWKLCRLGKFIVERNEKSTAHDQHPVLTSSRKGLFYQSDYFSKQVTSSDNEGYKIVNKGDFTYRAMSDDGKFTFNRLDFCNHGIISPAYGVFYPKNINSDFLLFYMNSSAFFREVLKESQGGTRISLKLNAMKKILVSIPSIELQNQIAETLSTAQREIDLLKQLADKYKIQKRGLMQRLLTGEWRIKPDVVKTFEECHE